MLNDHSALAPWGADVEYNRVKPSISSLHILLWLVGVLICVGPALASGSSSDWIHRAWETEHGLPDNDVTGVGQSRDGYLWVATKGGMMRFNGAQFKEFPVIELPGVPSRAVRAMVVDKLGRLWFAMERGPVICLDGGTNRSFDVADGLLPQRVADMGLDHEGGVWISYVTNLRRIHNGIVQSIELPSGMEGTQSDDFASDAAGNLWLAKGQQLAVWRDQRLQVVARLPSNQAVLAQGVKSGLWICSGGRLFRLSLEELLVDQGPLPVMSQPLCLLEDDSGALWLGTFSDGLLCRRDGHWEKVPTSHPEISCLTRDEEGNLWAGTTGGGLNLIRTRVVELQGKSHGLPVESLRSVCEDRDGVLWVVSQSGEVARCQGGAWSVENLPALEKANCVMPDASGGVWIGTGASGVRRYRDGEWTRFDRRQGLPGGNVRSLFAASNGDVWIALSTPGRLVRLRDNKITLIHQPEPVALIRAMVETTDGTIWIGTSEGQLMRVQGDALVREIAVRKGITLSIRALHATPDGSLWIGYAGDGLGRLKNGVHSRVTTEEGLLDDYVSQVLSDGAGSIWIFGNRGLSRVSQNQLDAVLDGQSARVQSRNYGRNDGLPAVQPSRDYSPTCWRTADGRLCFTTRNGLLVVQPERVPENPNPPPVVIESVLMDDERVAVYGAHSQPKRTAGQRPLELRGSQSKLFLPANHRKIQIQFAGLSYAAPENVEFRYRLAGFDQKWVEVGGAHSATYPQLPAGDYEFQVLACNNAGVWNESGAHLTISVPPFFWETWWFRLLVVLTTTGIVGGTMYFLARRRYRRKLRILEARRALEQERSRIAKDIHDDLGASLTQITLLSQMGATGLDDPQGAVDSLRQIQATARDLTQAMGEVVWAVNPEHDTLDGLVNYLTGFATSFLTVAGVRCRLELPLSLPQQVASAEVRHNLFLAFKEALNNVVKHAQATEVHISLTLEPGGFRLQVTDDGRGMLRGETSGAARVGGYGLPNMQTRIAEIGGRCEIKAVPEGGTQVVFFVPLRERVPE